MLTSWGALMWGIWIVLPFPTFGVETFDILAAMAPEALWGWSMILIGTLGIYALLRHDFYWRTRAMFLVFIAWAIVGGARIASDYVIPSGVVDLTYSIGAGWAYLRLATFER